MADTAETPAAELQAHERTWSGFKAMMTWGTLIVFLIGAGVVLLIAPK
ncbi:MAG: aa3-type cytochrome c oxidase subunit IV [Sphingomonas sp.]